MQIIEITPSHLPEALALVRASGYGTPLDLAWLRHKTLDDPVAAEVVALGAQEDGALVGYCFACKQEDKGLVKLMGVRPDARRRGVATALLAEAEGRLRALGAVEMAVGALGPGFFEPGVEPQQTDLVAFLLKLGYTTDRNARINMDVNLADVNLETAADEARLAAEGFVIRRATLADIEATAQFALDNFSESWRYESWQAARFDPHPMFVALDGERVVAFACYDVTVANWFGPTGTHPDYRQRGIGGVLLKLCLRSIRDRGGELAEICWAGPIHYYAHTVNARIHRIFWLFRKPLVTPDSQPA